MSGKSRTIYLAAPVFRQVDRQWNRTLARALEAELSGVRVVLPQDFRIGGRFNDPDTFPDLYKQCAAALRKSDCVLAVLDGADCDSGVAFEAGLAAGLDIPVLGLRTDYRAGQDKGLNLMLAESCTVVVREYSFNEDIDQLAATVARRLRKILEADTPSTRDA